MFGCGFNYTQFVGGKTFDSDGRVVKARTLRSIWVTEWDTANATDTGDLLALSIDVADPLTMAWESKLLDSLHELTRKFMSEADGYELLVNAQRRCGPVSFLSC